MGRVQYFQTLNEAIPGRLRPYSRLPQIRLDTPGIDLGAGLRFDGDAEFVHFDRSEGVTGQRFDLHPGIRLPLRAPWGFAEPRLTAWYTGYWLDGASDAQNQPDRALGTFSFDSGLFFDRPTQLFEQNFTQTLEPRLFFLYVPETEQADLPVFDTNLLDFNFDGLFRINRYNGPDRVGDANQITLALTSRSLADEDGSEWLRADIGQILTLEDQQVGLPGERLNAAGDTTWVTQVGGRLMPGWRYRAGMQFDPDAVDGELRQGLAQLSYQDGRDRYWTLAYRLRQDLVEQTDTALLWPISPEIKAIARWNYSLLDNTTLETLAGVEFGRCCWQVRALARHYVTDAKDEYDTGFMLELELRGLGGTGNNIDRYLEKSFWGYEARDDDQIP
jgi:LPS-assembly protein